MLAIPWNAFTFTLDTSTSTELMSGAKSRKWVHQKPTNQPTKVGWLVSGAPTFVIWHDSLIHSSDFAPFINSGLVLVSIAKVKVFYAIDKKVNYFDNNIKRLIFHTI